MRLPLQTPPMTEAITDPPVASCYCLFCDSGIEEFQQVAPDLFLSRAHARETARCVAGLPLSPTFAGMAFVLATA
jgi:hypothetical protein